MISIILPTYNNLTLFKQALQGIQIQKGVRYEVIVVDDSSNNEIENYVRGINNIKYYHNNPSLGAVKNWNFGLSLAEGEMIILHHHDEFLVDEHHLSKIANALISYDVVISNIKVNRGDGYNSLNIPSWLKRFTINVPSLLMINNIIGPCACVAFNRNITEEFDENLVWKVDSEWYYRILKNKKCVYLEKNCVYSSHGHSDQITKTINVYDCAIKDLNYLKTKYNNPYLRTILFISLLLAKIRNR